jgi:effector-binding domain-containing protein
LVALKELGFGLEQLRPLLGDDVSLEQLRGMLLLRRTELADQIRADTRRLNEVESRLRSIESEGSMSDKEYVIKSLPPLRIAKKSATVAEQPEVGPVVGPLFDQVADGLHAAGMAVPQIGVATYDMGAEGGILITAGFPVSSDVSAPDVEVVDLPAVERAATVVHNGRMDTIGDSWMALLGWVEQNGLQLSGPGREYYHETPLDRPDDWVTELQQPVA